MAKTFLNTYLYGHTFLYFLKVDINSEYTLCCGIMLLILLLNTQQNNLLNIASNKWNIFLNVKLRIYHYSYAIENPILMGYPIGNSIEYAIESHGISYSKCTRISHRISHRIFLGIPQNILLNFIEYAIEYAIEYVIEYAIEYSIFWSQFLM